MTAYYNENDPGAAAWLRELIKEGLIAPGTVDERSIEDVRPTDLRGYTQCHFFAGIGGWSYALRLAGWPDDRPVWTGSCPCQPFSTAGQGKGAADERHLWPSWFWLIEQCRPDVIFGEQVEAAVKHGWLDLVSTDLEGIGYAVGAVAFPACGVGAPHKRSRLYFVADSEHSERWSEQRINKNAYGRDGLRRGSNADELGYASCDGRNTWRSESGRSECITKTGDIDVMEITDGERCDREPVCVCGGEPRQASVENFRGGPTNQLAYTIGEGLERLKSQRQEKGRTVGWPGTTNGFWSNAEWLPCRDGKYRAVEPGSPPLAHGVPARVVRLRGYGNAIVAPQAAEFIKAYKEIVLE